MANLPSGVKKVYNHFYKRKSDGGYTPTPTQIKEYFESKDFDVENINDDQFNEVVNYFSPKQITKPEPQSVLSPELAQPQERSQSVPVAQPAPLTISQKQELVSLKAQQMNIVLSGDDVQYVANQINQQTNSTLDEVINQVESALVKFADYKKRESEIKINEMFGRVYSHVEQNNYETSQQISQGLRHFGQSIEEAQQDFKSSVLNALKCLDTPA